MTRFLAGIALAALIVGCDNTSVDPPIDNEKPQFPGISRVAPSGIQYMRDTIVVQAEGTSSAAMAASGPVAVDVTGADGVTYDIVQVARLEAPMVNGQRVQANDIIVDQSGRTAYIAYNYQGEPWVGAIQVVDITKKAEPVLIDEFHFEHMDINALDLDGHTLLIAGAANPDVAAEFTEADAFLSFAAQLDVVTMDAAGLAASVVGLPSFAGTGICRQANNYYVSVGAEGGSIQALDASFAPVDAMLVGDVRDVDAHANGIIAIAGTTDTGGNMGNLILASPGALSNPMTVAIPDFGSDYHKATIEVWEGTHALLGLSEAGFKVLDLRSPESGFLFEIDNPEPPAEGMLPNTNSVSTDGNLVFTANGEYGFRVFRPNNNKFQELALIGFHRSEIQSGNLEDKYSANHVEMKAGHLFVASGAYGVFVYTLEKQ